MKNQIAYSATFAFHEKDLLWIRFLHLVYYIRSLIKINKITMYNMQIYGLFDLNDLSFDNKSCD